MSDEARSPDSYTFKEAFLHPHGGGTPLDMRETIQGMMYYEDISKPFISMTMRVIDSGFNVRSSGPIQGNEKVTLVITDAFENDFTYEFYTYILRDIVVANKVQTYVIGLISKEALQNEGVRINKSLKGYPHDIAQECVVDFLKSDKDFHKDEATNKMAFIASNKTPFTVCSMILNKSLSSPTPRTGSDGDATATEVGSLTGHAGFLFFENAKGFNFKSINNLCDPEKGDQEYATEGKTFTDSVYDASGLGAADSRTIAKVEFTSEINVMAGLRLGAYCCELQTYNMDTGYVETSLFSANDEYSNQSHLGSSDSLTEGQKELAKTPTRITSAIMSSEAYYSGQDVAEKDAEIKDWTKNTLTQSISRNYLLNTQGLRIDVPGNLDLVVGEKIKVILSNSVAEAERETDPIDTVNSGIYLITKLSRNFNRTNMKVTTVLKLQRDSYGSDDGTTT